MDFTLTTPALLFSTVSLLMLAYTNRFLALSARIRNLLGQSPDCSEEAIACQIANLRRRVMLIRNMQALGVFALFLCVFCMFVLFAGLVTLGKIVFGLSLILLMCSLALSLKEIWISVDALNIQLASCQHAGRANAVKAPAGCGLPPSA